MPEFVVAVMLDRALVGVGRIELGLLQFFMDFGQRKNQVGRDPDENAGAGDDADQQHQAEYADEKIDQFPGETLHVQSQYQVELGADLFGGQVYQVGIAVEYCRNLGFVVAFHYRGFAEGRDHAAVAVDGARSLDFWCGGHDPLQAVDQLAFIRHAHIERSRGGDARLLAIIGETRRLVIVIRRNNDDEFDHHDRRNHNENQLARETKAEHMPQGFSPVQRLAPVLFNILHLNAIGKFPRCLSLKTLDYSGFERGRTVLYSL